MRKDIFREIYHTIGRFVGILVIVALGVSFFSGLGTTGDDMKLTGDFYFDSQDLMDIRVISTYGLNDRDILAIKQTPGVLSVYPAYSVDAISSKSDASVIKVHSLEEINRPVLYYGRAPTSRAECLLDASLAWDMKVGIGDVVELESGKETDIRNSLRTDRYKVVGLVRSPFYVSVERGSSSVGDGAADGYMYIPPENFLQEVYTEAFVLVEGAKDLLSFGDPYLDLVDLIVDRLEDAADVREFERYQEMTDKAFSELELARKNLEIKRTSAQLEIDEAENSILESSRQLYSASYDQTAGYAQILESLRSLDAQEAQLDAGLVTVALSQAQLESQLTGLRKTRRELQDQLFELDGQDQQLLGQLSVVGSSNPYAKAQIVAARAEISSGRSQVEDGLVEVSGGVTAILKGVEEIEAQKSSLAKSKRDLQTGRDSLEASLRSMTENTLQASDARASLDAAALELAVTKNSTKKSLDLAEKEIVAAQKSLDDLEEPQWYVLDRDATPGYASFSQDTDKIEAIGRVFPLIFFLVAALVSLTTMTRLVEERRGEIGTLKSLGYSNSAIMRKYIFYAAIPTLIGGLFGGWFGMEFFPGVIINAYSSMLYSLPPPVLKLDPKYWGIGMGAAFLCTVLAAVISCNAELRETPSSLMRPKPPKVGKRTFLEALPFLWKSLNFTQKVTLRNIIRYKKRFYMTVIGIAGCSSLLLTGFGILDSISAVMGLQYSQIRVYDLSVAFTDSAKQRDLVEVGNLLTASGQSNSYTRTYEKTLDAGTADSSLRISDKAAILVVPEDMESFPRYVAFRERVSNDIVKPNPAGVLVTERLSAILKVGPGDKIVIKDGDTHVTATVTGVVENYLFHYIFMDKELYLQLFGESAEYNTMYSMLADENAPEASQLANDILGEKGVSSVAFAKASRDSFGDIVENLNFVIIVIITSAGALALVVLLNLSSINISERMRELATIEVLGFTDREVSDYVFRESAVLTAIGALAGLLLGRALHLYVLLSVETDLIMFSRSIKPVSFFYSLALTAVFSMAANIFSSRRLKKIHMVEALKSVE